MNLHTCVTQINASCFRAYADRWIMVCCCVCSYLKNFSLAGPETPTENGFFVSSQRSKMISLSFVLLVTLQLVQALPQGIARQSEERQRVGANFLKQQAARGANLTESEVKFRYLTTGPCTSNDNQIFHYGSRMATSTTLLAISVIDGQADVQCIVQVNIWALV